MRRCAPFWLLMALTAFPRGFILSVPDAKHRQSRSRRSCGSQGGWSSMGAKAGLFSFAPSPQCSAICCIVDLLPGRHACAADQRIEPRRVHLADQAHRAQRAEYNPV